MNDPSFWNSKEHAESVIKQMNELKEVTEDLEKIKREVEEKEELLELLKVDPDIELMNTIQQEMPELSKKLEEVKLFLLLNGPYDHNNCILEIHSGAGGTEACDWANMLYRMYLRYCEKHGYKTELLDYQEGDETGIKSTTIRVIGTYAYGYLK